LPVAAPRLLYLDGRPHTLAIPESDGLTLQGRGGLARITGAFADSVGALLDDHAEPSDLQRLRALESSHPWLHGLHRCSPHAPSGLASTVLPLGMLFVELTARCNERCIHCYAESGPERTEALTQDEVRAVLDAAVTLGRPFVQFTGGDPLIHPDLVEMVAHARAVHVAGIEIYTNGLLLNDALITRLLPHAPRLSFSIYADTPEIHDAITRVPGSWNKTLAAMHRARDAGLEIRAGVALMDENLDAAGRMPDFLHRELGLTEEHIRFDAVKQAGRGRESPRLQQRYTGGHTPAGATAQGKLCVAADGQVYPCIFARSSPLGDIRSQGLDAIVRGLETRRPAMPSAKRWTFCRHSLSCLDCQMHVYALGAERLESSA